MSTPKETHTGTIKLGNLEVDCAVLDTGERVLSTTQVQGVLSASKNRMLDRTIATIPNDSGPLTLHPRMYKTKAGRTAHGYVAEDIVNLLRALQRAFLREQLHHKQIPMAMAAMACLESLASVGLVAIIDEATGFQSVRPDTALRDAAARAFSDHKQAWERTFDADWDREFCRLYGHTYTGKPPVFVKQWNHTVYEYALGKTLKTELKAMNPNPKFGDNHSQYLSTEAKISVSQVIHTVKAIMKTSRHPADFRAKLAAVFSDLPFQLGW